MTVHAFRKRLQGSVLILPLIFVLVFVNLSPSIAAPSGIKPTPTAIISLTFEEIKRNIEDAGSGRERDAYFETIKGIRVRWSATVNSGDSESVLLNIGGLFWSVHLEGISIDQAPKDSKILFEATIADYSRFLGMNFLDLDGVVILSGGASTPTPKLTATQSDTLTPTATQTHTPTATPTSTPAADLVLGGNTYLRVGPGPNYQAKQMVYRGTALPVYSRDEKGQWLLVDPLQGLWVQSYGSTLSAPATTLPLAPSLTPTPTRTLVPTRTPIPSPTPRPSATPVPAVAIETIYNNLQRMTELQFTDYKKTLVGKPVRQRVKVGNVNDQGNLLLSGDWSPLIFNVSDFCVVVRQTPREFARSLDPGETFFLEAIIQGIVSDYGYYLNCENTLILTYKSHSH